MINFNNYLIIFYAMIIEIIELSGDVVQKRNERALLFPSSSTVGIFIALAIPLELKNRNVFLSYNFEANYNLPYQGSDYIPGPFQRLEFEFDAEDSDLTEARKSDSNYNSTDPIFKSKFKKAKKKKKIKNKPENKEKRSAEKSRPLITRTQVYSILGKKLKYSGYQGKECILRTICETNYANIGFNNGVLGHIFQIIFTPTSSEDEQLPYEYYEAEWNGINGLCHIYNEKCPANILDLISKEFWLDM